jgi:hypothetical protein
MDTTQQRSGGFQQALLALTPALSSLAYLARDKEFTWRQALLYILPLLIPVILTLPSPFRCMAGLCSRIGLRKQQKSLQFTARIRLRSWAEEPDAIVRLFSMVLWKWNQANELVNCYTLDEEATHTYFVDAEYTGFQPLFVNDDTNPFWHKDRPHILYKMWVERQPDRDGILHSEIFLQIQIREPGYSPRDLIRHIDDIRKWAETIQNDHNQKQRVLVTTDRSSSRNRDEDGNSPVFMSYEFATTSAFKNFFCDEVEIVKRDLDYFLHHKAAYERTGRPWTYTILNSGPPGVGKTKLVKSIAALTGRTLIVINLNHIRDITMLYDAFHSSVLAGQHVDHTRRLYYIPEVDTQALEVLKKRDDDETPQPSITPLVVQDTVETKSTKYMKKSTAADCFNKKPTLGEILNVLDGVPERHGHILVLDTNYLDRLDPALVRPGRVDRILSWNKMSSRAVHDYLENYFETQIPKTVVFPNHRYTAAELQAAVCLKSSWQDFVEVPIRRTRLRKN